MGRTDGFLLHGDREHRQCAVRRYPQDDFDARRHAISKRYVYRILNRGSPSPLRRGVAWHLRGRLDVPAMKRAAAHLVGEHDFEALRGAPGGAPAHQSTLRTLDSLDVRREGDECRIEARAQSFLRYMVRNIVGTLVEVGAGRLEPDALPKILASRDRSRSGPTALACGLCLASIDYPEL